MPETTLDIVFPAERDIDAWQVRHARGAAPGFWPYGLDGLGRYVDRVRTFSATEPAGFARARRRALGWWTKSSAQQAPHARHAHQAAPRAIALSWDENAARRMLGSCRRAEMYSGVIWATDAVQRGTDLAAVRRTLLALSGLWVLSRAQLEPVRQLVGPNGPRVGFVQFGVDETFFVATPRPSRPLVLSIGGDRDRDTATLFGALSRVHDHAPDAEIIVQTANSLAPPPGVTVIPKVDHVELRALYSRASVVAIATKDNLHASGMTVSLEAMASGRPVVMTSTPGIRDYVQESTGVLVPVGDPGALAEQVLRLLAEPDRAGALGRAGRDAVVREFTTERLSYRLAEFIGLTPPEPQAPRSLHPAAGAQAEVSLRAAVSSVHRGRGGDHL